MCVSCGRHNDSLYPWKSRRFSLLKVPELIGNRTCHPMHGYAGCPCFRSCGFMVTCIHMNWEYTVELLRFRDKLSFFARMKFFSVETLILTVKGRNRYHAWCTYYIFISCRLHWQNWNVSFAQSNPSCNVSFSFPTFLLLGGSWFCV